MANINKVELNENPLCIHLQSQQKEKELEKKVLALKEKISAKKLKATETEIKVIQMVSLKL